MLNNSYMKQVITRCVGCVVSVLWVTIVFAQPAVTRIEYYIDKDPGYDNGIALDITRDTDLSNLSINIDPSSLSNGVHLVGVRAKDANGAWGYDNKWFFAKPYPPHTIK